MGEKSYLSFIVNKMAAEVTGIKGINSQAALNLFPLNIPASSNGNIFRVTGPLWGEFTGHQWIPLTNGQ